MAVCTRRHRFARLVVLFAALTLLLTGCDLGGQRTVGEQWRDQTLKMVLSSAPFYRAYLDPAQGVYYLPSSQPVSLLFDGLVTLDHNGHIEPWGAQSWTISPDGLSYTFKLRASQRFSDGTLVHASDYAWSIDRLVNPCLNADSLHGVNFEPTFLPAIKDAVTFHSEGCVDGHPEGALHSLIGDSVLPDDGAQTLTIHLAHSTGYFLSALTMPLAAVIERSVVGPGLGGDGAWTQYLAEGATGRGGSGMFYLASDVPGPDDTLSELVLKPNPYWWGIQAGKRPHFSTVALLVRDFSTFTSDSSIAYGGTIGPQMLSQSMPDLKKQPYYHEVPSIYTTSLAFNWTIAPFDDINARKAFCLAINREQLNQQVYSGTTLPSWHLVPRGMDGYNARLQGVDGASVMGDATRAKQYWQKYLAAHSNHAPPITFIDHSGTVVAQKRLAAMAQSWQAALAVSVPIVPSHLQSSSTVSKYEQLAIPPISVDYADPAASFLPGFSVISGDPWSPIAPFGTGVPKADALLKQADALSDMRQRIPLYQQAEQLLIDSATVCPLFQVSSMYALRPWVKGDFAQSALGIIPNDAWTTGYIAQH